MDADSSNSQSGDVTTAAATTTAAGDAAAATGQPDAAATEGAGDNGADVKPPIASPVKREPNTTPATAAAIVKPDPGIKELQNRIEELQRSRGKDAEAMKDLKNQLKKFQAELLS